MEDDKQADDYYELLIKARNVHSSLLQHLDYEKLNKIPADFPSKREFLLKEIQRIQRIDKVFDSEMDIDLLNAVVDEVLGFGPLETLLRDKSVTDILVNGYNSIFIEKEGKLKKTCIRFIDDEHLYRLLQKESAKAGHHIDLGNPHLSAQLSDGSRMHAMIPPIAINGVKLSIRKFLFKKLPPERLLELESISPEMLKFLQIAVQARFNIVICGGTGSGKTTLLNILLDSVPDEERVLTIEDTPELEPTHHHVVRLVTRTPNPEGEGGISQEDLMIDALRMRPDRVVLGELRGAEAFNLLHAMNTGQDGSMVTLHASGAEEALMRLQNMILMVKYSISQESVRQQITGAVDIVVYQARLVDGSRRIMMISQVKHGSKGDMTVDPLFQYNIHKISKNSIKGSFQKFSPPLSERLKNKLIVAGLYEDYCQLMFKNKHHSQEVGVQSDDNT